MIIIPARISSTRFKEKILYPIDGIPMIVRVAHQAAKVDSVIVAADDIRIIDTCKEHHIDAILTSKTHPSGTDRLAEATRILNLSEDEIIINVQGDEPFIEPEVITAVGDLLKHKNASMASAYRTITTDQAKDPNCVKVVTDKDGFALYFSRSPIPYGAEEYYGHLGIYAYRVAFLQRFCTFTPSFLEYCERLEQLRALHYGVKIAMAHVKSNSFGIDTQQDLEHALQAHGIKDN